MKSAFLESVFNMKEYVFPVEDEMYRKEMEIAENNNIDQVHIKEVIEMIKESGKYRLFVDSMNNDDENINNKENTQPNLNHNISQSQVSPKRVSAMASPPLSPGNQASRMAGTWSFSHTAVTGRPVCITRTTGVPVSATAFTKAS